MADAQRIVKEMAAECKRGQTPPQLEQFLRKKFEIEAAAKRVGWFSRCLSRLFGPPEPSTFEIRSIRPFKDGGFFRKTCVFKVSCQDLRLLDGIYLPLGGSFGLFSLGQDELRYLNHRQDNVEALLREEGRPLHESTPMVVASLIAEAFGLMGTFCHDVLASAEELASYNGGREWDLNGYELNAREWDRVQTRFVFPELIGDSETGWQLAFCTVFGWMHDKQKLIRHCCDFAPDFRINYEQEVLSHRIFKRVPGVRY